MNTRRSVKESRLQHLLFFIACALVGLLAFFFTHMFLNTNRTPDFPGLAEKALPLSPEDAKLAEEARLVYPYSIIPGGVRSGEELAAHIAEDKVVADHYSDFMTHRTRLVRAQETRMMHVSYRVGDQVYWTKNKVRIPEGELLVTDGECEARARCGNRVSASPMDPVADEEPLTETFDIPNLVRMTQPELPPGIPPYAMTMNPGMMSDPDGIPVLLPATPGQAPRSIYSEMLLPEIPSETVPVPEPGILVLLGTGLAALFTFRLFRRK
ncbi:MAG: PEP-CTERM sorting domain-containing protein [Acidobacteriota bacterium]